MEIHDNIIISYQVAVDNIDQVAVDKVDPLVDQYILALGWQEVGNPQDQVEVVVDSFVDPETVGLERLDMAALVEPEDMAEEAVEDMVYTEGEVDLEMVVHSDLPYLMLKSNILFTKLSYVQSTS